MNNEDPFNLRDQFAIATMQILLLEPKGYYKPLKNYITLLSNNDLTIEQSDLDQLERIALAAYKMADIMRKARLKAFE